MPNLLSDLVLTEVSLVDRPANKGARVVLFKRADPVEISPAARRELHKALLGILAKEAQTFGEIQSSREALEAVYPAFETLQESLYSILWDDDVADKTAAFRRSIDEFRDHLVATFNKSAGPADATAGASGTSATSKQEPKMDSDALEKRLSDLKLGDDVKKSIRTIVETVVADLTKTHEEALAKAKKEADEAVAKAKGDTGGEPKPLDKSALSPEHRAYLEQLEKRAEAGEQAAAAVAKMQEDAAVAAIAKRIEDIRLFKADEFAKHLRAIEKVDPEAAAAVEKALRAAAEQIKKGDLFKEHGRNQTGPGSATAEVEERVGKLRAAKPGMDIHAARAEVFKADRELADRYNAEQRKSA